MWRAAMFHGRSRERLSAIAEVFDIFVQLYPHHFQITQIIFNASIRDKTSAERQAHLQRSSDRLTATMTGIIRDAIAQGDLQLPPWSSPEILTFGLWSMAFGAHVLMAADKPHDALGIEEADALYSNYHALLDGLGWRLPHLLAKDQTPTLARGPICLAARLPLHLWRRSRRTQRGRRVVILAYLLSIQIFNTILQDSPVSQARGFPILFGLGVLLVINPLRETYPTWDRPRLLPHPL